MHDILGMESQFLPYAGFFFTNGPLAAKTGSNVLEQLVKYWQDFF